MLERLEETIVAISSAPGFGAVGIVRLSGPTVYELLNQLARYDNDHISCARRTRGEVVIDGAVFPAVFYLFRAPYSYTRQHLVEIHTIGSPAVLELIRDRLVVLGAVPAQPGEFTARAYFNGALDLNQAEGVAHLIRAQSDTQLQAARRMMDSHWSAKVLSLRDALAELLGLVEAGIDFAEEPIEFISAGDLARRMREMIDSFQDVQSQAGNREVFNPLPRILLLGPPNAGKSSLMNRLSGTSRAICAAVAGTTRDILSAPVRLGSLEATLLDAAGIDDSPEEVIAAARQLAMSAATTSDLVCVVLDACKVHSEIRHLKSDISKLTSQIRTADITTNNQNASLTSLATFESQGIKPGIVCLNKCDLLDADSVENLISALKAEVKGAIVPVSALRGDGIEQLREALGAAIQSTGTTVMSNSMAFSDCQRACVATALSSMQRAALLAEASPSTSHSADLLAFELREALDALGSVTGEVTTEDLLTKIFANFCIGK
jgi:tRNA modification GTPase